MSADAPLRLHRDTVQPGWIDYNGHMNVAYYVLVFDRATDALLDRLGMHADYRARTGCSVYVLEGHVTYEREVGPGESVTVTTQLLQHDARRLHFFHAMYQEDGGHRVATNEILALHVDTRVTRAAPFPAAVAERLQALQASHGQLPRPPQAGRRIGMETGRPGGDRPVGTTP